MKHTFLSTALIITAALVMSSFSIPAYAFGTSGWMNYASPSLVNEIIESGNELFMGTSGGILIYDLDNLTFSTITNRENIPSNNVTSLSFDNNGDLYIGTSGSGIGKLVFQGGNITVTAFNSSKHGLADDRITAVAVWGDTLVYGTMAGAGWIINDSELASFFVRDGLPGDYISDLLVDGDRVWIATRGGVAVIDRQGVITDMSAGLPDPDVRSLARTDSSIWAGTADGVVKFRSADSTWASPALANEQIFSLYYDGAKLWAGDRFSLFYYDQNVWSEYDLFPVIKQYGLNWTRSEIRALYKPAGGLLYIGLGDWVADRRGCNIITVDSAGAVENLVPEAPASGSIIRLSIDLDGSLWASTANFGVGKLTPNGQWLNYNHSTPTGDSLSFSINNNALLADSHGKKWFGSITYKDPQSGLLPPLDELDDGLDTDYFNDSWNHHALGSGGGDGLGTLRFERAVEDPIGNRWFLSDGFYKDESPPQTGISILDSGGVDWKQVTRLTTGGRMRGDYISDVAFAPGGIVYVAQKSYGVQKWITGGLDKTNLFDFSDDIWFPIGEIGDEFGSTEEVLSLAVGDDGALWIGTTLGLYRYRSGRFLHIRPKTGPDFGLLLGNHARDLVFDDKQNLWVATDLGLNRIYRDDYTQILYFTTPAAWVRDLVNIFQDESTVLSPLVNASCNALAFDKNRRLLYIATAGGLSILDTSVLTETSTVMSDVYVYPNPIRFYRDNHNKLFIANIHSRVTVQVYTLEGQLVHEKTMDPPDNEVWNLTTFDGFIAASGVYMVKVTGESGSIVKTVSLIR